MTAGYEFFQCGGVCSHVANLMRFCEPFFQARFTYLVDCLFDALPGQNGSISSKPRSNARRWGSHAYEYFFGDQTFEPLHQVRFQLRRID